MPRQETPESLVRKIKKTPGFTIETKTSGLGWMACNQAQRKKEMDNPDSHTGGWRTGIGTHFTDRHAFENCLGRLKKIGWTHKVYEEQLHAQAEARKDKARAQDAVVAENLFADWNQPEPQPEPLPEANDSPLKAGQAPPMTDYIGGGENVYDLSTYDQTKVSVRWVDRTQALEWLEQLPDYQRNRSVVAEREYGRVMLRGEWILHPFGLLFDPNGKLLDGQTRVGAIVWATNPENPDGNIELTVPFYVFENVPIAAYAATDQGRKRTLTHLMQSLQETEPGQFQATLRMLYLYDHVPQSEWASKRALLSNAQALAFRDVQGETIRRALRWKKLKKAKFNATSSTAAFAVLSRRYPDHVPMLDHWFGRLAFGFGMVEGDPTAALRTYVMTDGEADERSRLNLGDKRQVQFALILRTFVNALNGKTMMRVSPRRDMICPHDLPDLPALGQRTFLPIRETADKCGHPASDAA